MRCFLILLVLAGGCASMMDDVICSGHGPACKSNLEAGHDYDERKAAAQEQREQQSHEADLAARDEYHRALEPCNAGDSHACLTVAIYEDRHGAPEAQVAGRYRMACVRGVARACFFAGTHAQEHADQDLAIASFRRGCELHDGEACLAGYELAGKLDLLERACQEHFRDACARFDKHTKTPSLHSEM